MLLVGLPFFFITRAIAATEELPRSVITPGGVEVLTNMRDVHGAIMAAITVAFLSGLVGVFTMHAARQADRRLVVAGFRPIEALAPRLLLLAAATTLVVAVSLGVTALSFEPRSWAPVVAGTLVVGLVYALLGALAGATFGSLGATYAILFAAMLDLGIVQNPMFGSGEPPSWAAALPGYGPARAVVDGAFTSRFDAWASLGLGVAWALLLGIVVGLALRRLVAAR